MSIALYNLKTPIKTQSLITGEPSRYSQNDLWSNYNWQEDHHKDIHLKYIPDKDANHNVFNLEITDKQI